jgi:hypothetical protein
MTRRGRNSSGEWIRPLALPFGDLWICNRIFLISNLSLVPPEATALFRSCCGRKQEGDLLRTTTVRGMSIAIGLLLTAAPNASAQSAPTGDDAHGPRSTKSRPVTSGPDIWDANHDGIYTCDEWKSYLDRLFTLADRNRDGHLDPSEFSIIRRAGTALADADFGYFDENQDGKITRSEFVTSRVRLFCSSTRTVTAASRRTK